ncbi:MAG: acyl-CoA dehydrogenase family protein [Actinobacteria bacterium]|nr:acyl-CoA dehydrogenase family protein [Actinomycetota bacterium]
MDFEFSPDQEMLRDSVRRFLADRAPISFVREMYDDPRGVRDEVWKGLAALGVAGILVPEEHGGLGLGMVDMGVVLEELGRAVFPGPFLASAVGAVSLADPALLPRLASGDTVGTVALFEAGRRADWSSASTTAVETREGWALTGRKVHVPHGARADVLLVTASVADGSGGLGVFAVDGEVLGAGVAGELAIDGTQKLATVNLDATPARRVDGAGEAEVAEAVDRVTTALVVDGVGAASAALDMSIEYAKERVQFDRPIGSFQAVQHLCADMLRDLELARAGGYYALWACDEGDAATRHEAAVMAKAWASDALARVGASTIQVHGGLGFTWEHDAHLFYKRLLSLQHAFGGTTDHLEELAHLLLD